MPPPPHLDQRRTQEFVSELLERARAWIPSWSANSDEPDFGRALIEIAGRFSSEVAERLDRVGEKMRAGFLDWLAVQGDAARPARMPVVFKLADSATDPVPAVAPVRMQAATADAPVVFESETTVLLVPGGIGVIPDAKTDAIVAVDADADAYYLPPPGLTDLNPLQPAPTQWRLKSFSATNSSNLQLDPDSGLTPGMMIELAGAQYQITQVQGDIVTIAPPLLQDVETELVTKVTSFLPFDGAAQNWQEHALYLGDMDLFNIEAVATIEVSQAKNLVTGFRWEYWGKVENSDVDWQPLTIAPDADQKSVPGLLLKKDKKGSIEPRVVAGANSRWIRAFIKTSPGVFSANQLTVKVNCVSPPRCPATAAVESPPSDAMANTTPLVLSGPFYPLGRVPRQFDAFYLGNQEAFSKKNAKVSVCFEMSDATCLGYAAVRDGSFANQILAGVGKDNALHLLKIDPASGNMSSFRGPLRPPNPPEPNVQVNSATPVSLNSDCMPVIWTDSSSSAPNDFWVAVAAGGDIWIWHENASDPKKSGWKQHSSIPTLTNPNPRITDIIVLKSVPHSPSAVLSSGRFWLFQGLNWIQPGGPLRDYAALAPIYDSTGALTDSMVAVSTVNELYQLDSNGVETAILPVVDVDAGNANPAKPTRPVRPDAFEDAAHTTHVVAVSKDHTQLVAVKQGAAAPQTISLSQNSDVGGAYISTAQVGVVPPLSLQFSLAEKTTAGQAVVASWVPTFNPADSTVLFESSIPTASGYIGTPILVGNYLVLPGPHADAYVSKFDPAQRLAFSKFNVEGVIVTSPPTFSIGDRISVMPATGGNPRMEWQISELPSQSGGDVLYVVDPVVADRVADDPQLIKYSNAPTGTGTISNGPATKFTTTAAEASAILTDAILRIQSTAGVDFCKVQVVNLATNEITTATALPGANGDSLSYWLPTPAVARVVPVFEFTPSGDGNWDASILDHANIYFLSQPTPKPSPQGATAYGVIGGHPRVVALNLRWTAPSPALNTQIPFVIDGVIGTWNQQLADTASNPTLSWEYWNSKGWWNLDSIVDGTQNLKATGALQFNVPNDIASSDWAGKTNFWIRARLVGGDYGQEEVKVITTTNSSGQTVQTVERSSDNIKAPLILDFHVSYSICDPVLPAFVLSQDSGSTRDQSNANQTGGAVVEAFVPLGLTLGRLSGSASQTNPPVACPPECTCQSGSATTAATPNPTASPIAIAPATGRAILIGLTSPPSGAPVNILLLVDTERPFDAFAPMKIEALVGDRFIPIVTKDSTRGLGESGVLSLSFALAPTPRELFGQNLCWIRLTPANNNAVGSWMPTLRGVYLNAVWASATETLTRELVGSSQGAPNLTLTLARPPLLADSLELRVKEPLGDEERTALLEQDSQLVKNIPELPGDWILWKNVIDPGDESPDARVYALDESIGEIRFGDGQHGLIPPIGTDSIVAFNYQRTEPGSPGSVDAPANTITARAQLNLVSPVPTVESVIAADNAAGGAVPESVDRVMRFGNARLRHRERVVSAQDLEDIALESSQKIVQASCLPRTGYLRLIIVMKGANPQPSAAEIRELTRLLLAAAPPSLSASNVLRIEGPAVRKLRVELTLHIEDLDHAGDVGNSALASLTALFDTATGDVTKDGWALGKSPTDIDIAIALADTPRLQSIENVTLVEVLDQNPESPWPQSLGPNELVMLAADPVRIQFTVPEAVA